MRRLILRFDNAAGGLELAAALRDTPTADAVWNAAPFAARAQTWGEEVYFEAPVTAAGEADATDVVAAGEIAFWLAGSCIAIGYGRTPVSRGDEIRLASPCNVFADVEADVRALAAVPAGASISVERAG